MLIGFGFGPSSGIEIGNSGEVGSLVSQQYCLDNTLHSPMDDKVGPKIAHNSCNLPVHGGEVERVGGEEVLEMIWVLMKVVVLKSV